MAIVVDQPIINSPFQEPARHYRIRGGVSELVDARRPSGYMPGLRSRGGQGTPLEEEFVELPLVNEIRERVARWRAAGYPGATRTTLELLRHWRGRSTDERPLFFCQLEAVETAITVKVPRVEGPRVPVDDNSGDVDPRYLDLLERVKGKLPKRARGEAAAMSRDDQLLGEISDALATLASAWRVEFDRWAAEGRQTPPAMIVVCDQTSTAERVTDYLARGAVLPELANPDGEPERTLRIDSALLARAEEGAEGGDARQRAAEALRQKVATVGQPGQPGAEIRCVVSVQMLSEGWDARNVTQILGLRAFSSQLLCEQVVGRGLRRASYDDMTVPEYVDVYGIPFQAFPVKGERRSGPVAVKPQTLVQPLRDRAHLEIRFPRVFGYISDAVPDHGGRRLDAAARDQPVRRADHGQGRQTRRGPRRRPRADRVLRCAPTPEHRLLSGWSDPAGVTKVLDTTALSS